MAEDKKKSETTDEMANKNLTSDGGTQQKQGQPEEYFSEVGRSQGNESSQKDEPSINKGSDLNEE